MRFIHLVTGKKAEQISQKDIKAVPRSTVAEVIIKELAFGLLKLTDKHKQQIEHGRSQKQLKFKNGHTLPDGQVYSGQWNSETLTKEGYGLQVWPDGSKYEGFWSKDMTNGYGRFILADGDVFVGDWVNDKAHGHGEYHYAEGASYKG